MDDEVHWLVELSDPQRRHLLGKMQTYKFSGSALDKSTIEQLEAGVQRAGPLPPPVDWGRMEKRAAMGYSVADQIYDNDMPRKPDV